MISSETSFILTDISCSFQFRLGDNMEIIEEGMPCPICKNIVMSDADTLKYCKTCGMSIKYDLTSIKRHNRKFYFCSECCKNLFLRFGFKSFRMHNMQKVN